MSGCQKSSNAKKPLGLGGLIENPLLAFLHGNCIIHSTAMIRKSFLSEHMLQYENYSNIEDFKLWIEIAKLGGRFYVDTQPLSYSRATDEQKQDELQKSLESIINEIIEFLISVNRTNCPELELTVTSLKKCATKK